MLCHILIGFEKEKFVLWGKITSKWKANSEIQLSPYKLPHPSG